jgi:exopolysaccharide biosynthesis polyprenyl glycosylphosphotransferase
VIKQHRRSFRLLRLGMDLALLTGAYFALYLGTLRLANPLGLVLEYPDYAGRLPFLLGLCWMAALLGSRVYGESTRRAGLASAFRHALKALALMLLVFSLGLFAFKIQFLSRKFMAVYAACCLGLLTANFSLEYRVLQALRAMGFNTLSVLLVGDGEGLRELWRQFESHREWGYRVVGLLGLGAKRGAKGQGPRSLGNLSKLPEILRTRIVDEIVVALPLSKAASLAGLLESAAQSGVNLRLLVDPAFQAWQVQADPLGGLPTLSLSQGESAPYRRMFKAALDLAGSLLLIAVLSPLLLLVALAIRLSMGGPVLFLQKRAGRNGRAFFLYKFRTMVADARAQQEKLGAKNQMSGPVFKLARDPRITPLGRFLRKYSLDELPQLLNVLRGEISLVGPRPLAMYEARKVPAWAWRRFSVKPGITCLWQISGRNQIDFKDWMKLDLDYVDHWSLGLDFTILLKTPAAVLSSKGAY